ncbi:uncharacterized protein LOC113341579 [Papaver somniferum]|uniref:uncharacterized protein LOC113341579 n=1 Tax=Papaver somniferum TaxID=3469 RepID=UPI000E6FE56B|nr:uncharacterized protein LOC113341579 [Papaver somniferum]
MRSKSHILEHRDYELEDSISDGDISAITDALLCKMIEKNPLPPKSYIGEDAAETPTVKKLIEVHIGDEKHKTTFVGADLPAHERDGLITLLRANADVFAWSFAEMPGIDPNVAFHRLNIDEKFHPVRHKIRNMSQSKRNGVTAEVEKLLEAGFIRSVQYPRWLSNFVTVPKKNGKIRVCIDFTDLNKACPSDPYPQPRIRDLVDATSGYERLSFMDGATYQHLVDHMFKDLIGKSMEVYIDDMVVKSEQKESHFLDFQKTFDILRKYRMKLNPAKCSFGLSSGKFLGYLMTPRGIEANPELIRSIREISSPRTKKEVQKLAGQLASLNRFISRSSDRFKPFFDVLKKAVNFGWTDECEKAFDEIKQYFSTPPVLVSPKTGQPIGVYLAATENAVSAVLFVTDPHEKNVLRLEISDGDGNTPLKRILERADDSIRLAIWSNFLGAYEIKYETRTAEKGHALAALLADFPVDDIETIAGEEEELFKPIESATNQMGARVRCVILTPEGSRIEKATWLGFQASNNEVEYETAIIGLKVVKQLDAKNVKLVTDSMLVVNQFLGTYITKEERMALYLDHIRELANEFDQFSIGQRPRLENRHVNALEYLSSAVETDTSRFVVVDFQELPSISDNHFFLDLKHASGGERATTSAQGDTENVDSNMDVEIPVIDDSSSPTENTSDWRQPYVRYLTTSELPEDEHLPSKVKKNALRYAMIEGQLYRKLVALEPFLRCISAEEGQQIFPEAHEGICAQSRAHDTHPGILLDIHKERC